MSQIAEFFAGKTVLVTGGSGFMGKVLIEKLLYRCPDIDTIYLLLRQKKGKSTQTRIEEITNSILFDRVRKDCADRLGRLKVVGGDIGLPDLGLSEEDRQTLVKRVNVVYHVAATVRFNAPFEDALNLNVGGTKRMLDLCLEMQNLQVVVHVSTAFCHVDYDILEEKVYPPTVDPEEVLRLTNWMDHDNLEYICTKLMKPHPNSYTYTKRLAEMMVSKYHPRLPIIIMRPSIVIPSVSDPMPGWVDNINGPVGLMIGAGKGVIRSMHVLGDIKAEVIPVDMAVNGFIAIAALYTDKLKGRNELMVCNLTQGETNVATWAEILDLGRQAIFENPFQVMLWYPNGDIRSNRMVHEFFAFFLHWIPAYLIDAILYLVNQKQFMVKVQRRIKEGMDVIQYFTTRPNGWKFKNERFLEVRGRMNEIDRENFCLDMENVDPLQYMKNAILGARHFYLKEDPESLPSSRRRMKYFYIADVVARGLFYFLLFYMLFSIMQPARSALDSILSATASLPFVRTILPADHPV